MKKILTQSIFILLLILLSLSVVYAKEGISHDVDLNLTIAEYVELILPDSIDMDVQVDENEYAEANFFLRTNCKVNLTIKSSGFYEEDAVILNDYIEYELDGYFAEKKASSEFGSFVVDPGTSYNGKFRVKWLGELFAETEWQSVTTGNYHDTITVTISY